MKKIFKYPYDPISKMATIPKDISILRIEYVKDAFYYCSSVWGIVNVGDERVETFLDFKYPYSAASSLDHRLMNRRELKIKEKQSISLPGPPIIVKEDDGHIFVYYYTSCEGKSYDISFYKTGQEITEDLSDAIYLGIGCLWIVQELALYAFWTNTKV